MLVRLGRGREVRWVVWTSSVHVMTSGRMLPSESLDNERSVTSGVCASGPPRASLAFLTCR